MKAQKLQAPPVSCTRPAYERFQRELAKALLIATAENRQYRSGRFDAFRNEIDSVIEEHGEQNIFMSMGISAAVSALEVFLRDIFLCYARHNPACWVSITAISGQEIHSAEAAEEAIQTSRSKFNFQNLRGTANNFERALGIDLKEVLNEEKRNRGFEHPDPKAEKTIKGSGAYDYLVRPRDGGLALRHRIIHEAHTAEESKAIFFVLYEILKYFSTSLVEHMYGVDFDAIPE